MKFVARAMIERPANYVFDVLARPDLYLRHWSRGVVKVTDVSPQDTPASVFRVVSRDLLGSASWTYSVLQSEPPSGLFTRVAGGPYAFSETFALEGASAGTSVCLTQEVELRGATRMLAPFFRKVGPHLLQTNLDRLKAFIESPREAVALAPVPV